MPVKALELGIDITIHSDADKKLTTLEKKIDAVGKKMQTLGKNMTKFFTLPILAAGTASVKLASDFDESLNKIDVAFKDSQDVVLEWSESTADNIGVSQGAALDMVATMGDMATAMGLTTDEAAKMGTELVDRAGDLSSFKNIRLDIAETALKGIFTGETESLKTLGVVMTQANLEIFALSKGIKTNIKDMTQAEKVNLRYAFVMDATANAANDFSNTSDSMANTLRSIKANLENAAVALGQKLLPIIKPVVDKILDFVKGLSELDEEQLKMIITIGAVVAATGPAIAIIGKLITTIKTMKTVLTFMTGAGGLLTLFVGGMATLGIALAASKSALDLEVESLNDKRDALEEANKNLKTANELQATYNTLSARDLEIEAARLKQQSLIAEADQKEIELINEKTEALMKNLNVEKTEEESLKQQARFRDLVTEAEKRGIEVDKTSVFSILSSIKLLNAQLEVEEARNTLTINQNKEKIDAIDLVITSTNVMQEETKEIVIGTGAIDDNSAARQEANRLLEEEAALKEAEAEAMRMVADAQAEEEQRVREMIEAREAAQEADTDFYNNLFPKIDENTNKQVASLNDIATAKEEAEARRQEASDKEAADIAAKIEQYKMLYNAIMSGANSVFGALGELYKADEKASIDAIENKVETGVLTEAEGEKQIAAVKKEAAKKEWELKGLSILSSIAQGVTTAVASAPWPFNLPALGFAAATGTLQVAAWQKAKPFAEGGEVPGNPNTGDSVPAMLTPGEVVLTGRMQENLLALANRPAVNYSTNNNYAAQAQRIDVSLGNKLLYSEINDGLNNRQIRVPRRALI